MLMYTVSGKKRPKCFFVIYAIKLVDSDEIWCVDSWINFCCKIIHLTWIMHLQFLVKLEMLIAHVLPLSCYRKKLQNLYPTSTVASNSPELNWVDNSMWKMLQEKVYITSITDLELSTTPLTNGCRNDMIQLCPFRSQSPFQFIQISYAYFVHLLLQ